jgi:hypothetical protein
MNPMSYTACTPLEACPFVCSWHLYAHSQIKTRPTLAGSRRLLSYLEYSFSPPAGVLIFVLPGNPLVF